MYYSGNLKNILKAITPYGILQLYSKFKFVKPTYPPWNPNGKPNPMRLWEDDNNFNALYQKVKGISTCGIESLFMLYQFVKHTLSLDGDIAEFGGYRGGSARILLEALGNSEKIVHLFDTWYGFPAEKIDPAKDWHHEGQTAAILDEVLLYLTAYDNCRFYPGIFPDTTTSFTFKKFCCVHIDADIYQSVKDGCHFFYPRMVKGGIIIFDDYGYWGHGDKMAVDEFFADKPEYPCYLHSGQSFIIKT